MEMCSIDQSQHLRGVGGSRGPPVASGGDRMGGRDDGRMCLPFGKGDDLVDSEGRSRVA